MWIEIENLLVYQIGVVTPSQNNVVEVAGVVVDLPYFRRLVCGAYIR